MLGNLLRGGFVVAIFMANVGVSMAQAQNTQPGGNHQALRVKSILGAAVNLQGGNSVGTVQDIVLNDDGVVEYLIVSEGGKMVTVPWEAAKFNHQQRTAVINITHDQFRQIPTYTTERYPEFYTPEYRTQIYRYYGITPGRERRLDRRDDRRP